MPILHPWTEERLEDREETSQLIEALIDDGGWVLSRKVGPGEEYFQFLCQWWDLPNVIDHLIIIEHDNVPTRAQLRELDECPEPVCTIPYRLKTGSWSIGWIEESGWSIEFLTDNNYLDIQVDANWHSKDWGPIDFSGFGTVKFGSIRERIDMCSYPGWQKASDQPITRHWSYMDWWFASELKRLGLGWHVHQGYVKHNHRG